MARRRLAREALRPRRKQRFASPHGHARNLAIPYAKLVHSVERSRIQQSELEAMAEPRSEKELQAKIDALPLKQRSDVIETGAGRPGGA